MPSLFSRCGIGWQINLLGLVGVIGVLAIIGIDWWGAGQVARSNFVANRARQERSIETRIQLEMLQARRHEKDFLLRHDERYVVLQHDATEAALHDSEVLATRVTDQPSLAELVRTMPVDVSRYATQFATVVQSAKSVGLNENQGLLGKLRNAVHDVEDKLKSVAAPNAQIAMLMMRRAEKDFIARMDPQYGTVLKAQLKDFIAALDAAEVPAESKRELVGKMATYQVTFAQFMAGAMIEVDEIKKLSALYAEIEPRLATVDQQLMTDAEAAERTVESVRAASGRFVAWFTALAIITMIGLSWLIGRSIARPIVRVTGCMAALARGDLQTQVPRDNRSDEIGTMIRVVQMFKTSLIEAVQLRAEQETLRARAEADRKAALAGMADRIESETTKALHQVGARTDAMAETAEEMSASAVRTGRSAQSAAAASAQALANAQTVASAAEQLSASIREIGSQVAQSSAVVERAVAVGAETRATIETLNEQVSRIGAVADIIGDIAAKTNLLALNATIEAARAGDAGKGFAVVASEVKALATQTAHSTQEIAQHITQVRSATGASAAAVTRIEQTIGEINAIAGSIAAAVEEQGAATAEIARNVAETASATNEMTNHATEVSNEAEQTGKHAAEVREDAVALSTAVDDLRRTVVRVVRTSTDEVDRRRERRFPEDLTCQLCIAGQSSTAHVIDLSEHGAYINNTPPVSVGTHGTLTMDSVGVALPFSVRAAEKDGLHLIFELDEATATKFRPIPERLATRQAA